MYRPAVLVEFTGFAERIEQDKGLWIGCLIPRSSVMRVLKICGRKDLTFDARITVSRRRSNSRHRH